MRVLTPKVHGIIDYVSVVALAVAPTLFGFDGLSSTLAYALAIIHLTLTLLTVFPLGVIKVVPLRLHGVIELVVGVSLAAVPWLLAGAMDLGGNGRLFYTSFGILLIAVWFLSDYMGDVRVRP